MATPTNSQQNVLTTMQEKAIELLKIRNTLIYLVQMWTNEAMSTLADADIQGLAEFAGVTQTEAAAAKAAFDTLLTSFGDPAVGGSAAFRLLKIANKIP